MNLNTDSYFLDILPSPDVLTWSTTFVAISRTIKHLGLTKHHQKIAEITWRMVNRWKEMELQYTGKTITKHFGQPYLLKFSDELNILEGAMETRLGLRYTTHLISSHSHQKGFNEVCKPTFN